MLGADSELSIDNNNIIVDVTSHLIHITLDEMLQGHHTTLDEMIQRK